LQRVFSELIVSIAVPTTGIVLSILAGSLQSFPQDAGSLTD
jgi:hypothetical protein